MDIIFLLCVNEYNGIFFLGQELCNPSVSISFHAHLVAPSLIKLLHNNYLSKANKPKEKNVYCKCRSLYQYSSMYQFIFIIF